MDEAKLNLFLEHILYGDAEECRSAMEELGAKPDRDVISALIKLLAPPLIKGAGGISDAENWAARWNAIEALGKLNSKEVLGELTKYIHDTSAELRNAVMEVLAKTGRSAVDLLAEKLQSPDKDERIAAANTLGATGCLEAAPLLLSALKDENENVQYAAAEGLGKLKHKKATLPLLDKLYSASLWVKLSIISALGEIGDDRAVDALLNALEDELLRPLAIEALGKLQHEKACDFIIPYLTDENLQQITIIALAKISEKNNLPQFPPLLKGGMGDYSPFIKGGRVDFPSREIVLEVLKNNADVEDISLRRAAITLLGFMKDERAVPILVESMKDEAVSEDASRAIERIGEIALETLLPYLEDESADIRNAVAEQLGKISVNTRFAATAIQSLLSSLSDPDVQALRMKIYALGQLKAYQAVELLFQHFKNESPEVREAAISALSVIGTTQVKEKALSLIRNVEHSAEVGGDEMQRSCACQLLGSLRAIDATAPLIQACHDESGMVREKAVVALGMLRAYTAEEPVLERSEGTVIELASDLEPAVRQAAAQVLGIFKTHSSIKKLVELLKDEVDWVRHYAAKSLGNSSDKTIVDYLIPLLDDSSPIVKIAAVESLGKIGDPKSVPSLLILLRSPDYDIRRTVVIALSRIGGALSQKALHVALHDEHWSVRKAAELALNLEVRNPFS
ncbi:HEAT repeat domain-containing protein [Candidatus Poribacteria bacterium]|nr:HEAT repeat domain-containing protein [Candidatus Poribacteria bacterium]